MKNLSYALRNVLKLNVRNVIKILSLTFGLVVSTVFLSRVAFEQSFDKFHADADRIYHVRCDYLVDGESDTGDRIPDPVIPAMVKDLPMVECGTNFRHVTNYLQPEGSEERFSVAMGLTDTSFFSIFSFPDVSGGKVNLEQWDRTAIFLTEQTAERIFKNENPIGKSLKWEGSDAVFTVRGVLKNPPHNSTIDFDAIISIDRFSKRDIWLGGDRNLGYVKLKPGADPDAINAQMPALQGRYYDLDKAKEEGFEVFYQIQHLYKLFSQADWVLRIDLIMIFVSLIVLVVSSSNYTLITLASLTTRAKAVGIHKSSGASSADIRAMICWETFFNLLAAIILSVLLLIALRSQIETAVGVNYKTLFSVGNLWSPLVVITVIFVSSALLPAMRFSKIEVTEIFRNIRNHNSFGKKALVFSQFTLSLFVITTLIIVMLQYNMMINKDLGYEKEKLGTYVTKFPSLQAIDIALQTISNDPAVEGVSLSEMMPTNGMGGVGVEREGKMIFSSRFMEVDHRFLPLYSIPVLAGRNFAENNPYTEIIVNEKFCELYGWKADEAVGKNCFIDGDEVTVIGVTKDFHLASLYAAQMPLTMMYQGSRYKDNANLSPVITVKFREFTPLAIARLNSTMQKLLENQDISLRTYNDIIRWQLGDNYMFMIGLLIAAIVILIITVMGVYGFVSDEVLRRMREIGIRKVFGSTSGQVIQLLQWKILKYLLIATPFGLGAGYFGGYYMIQEFPYQIGLSWWIFASVFVFLFLVIALVVYFLVFKAARTNPSVTVK